MEDIKKHDIPIFEFPSHSDDDQEVVQENNEFRVFSFFFFLFKRSISFQSMITHINTILGLFTFFSYFQ